MILDKYISENELEEIRKKYGQKITKFLSVQREMTEFYKKFDLKYPNSCINNFRDSWFHYRKIWEEHSYFSIISQTSTLDEHLQRAERDAIVNLLQMISQKMEFWYLVSEKVDINTIQEQVGEEFFCEKNYLEDNDFIIQYTENFQENNLKANLVLVYAASVLLPNHKECYREMQDILHCIKNSILKIRLGASNIERLNEPGEYLKTCQNVVDKISSSKYSEIYIFLIQIYDVVIAHLDYFFSNLREKAN